MQHHSYFFDLIPEWLHHSHTFYCMVTSLEGHYTYTNVGFQLQYGFVTEDFMGKHALLAIHEEDWAKCGQVVTELLQEPEKIIRVQLRKPLVNGNHHWTDWEFSVLCNTAQQPIGIFCLGCDISQFKANEQHLEANKSQLEQIAWLQSHELRRPVANILGLVALLKDLKLSIEDQILLQHLQTSALELDKIIHQIVANATKVEP